MVVFEIVTGNWKSISLTTKSKNKRGGGGGKQSWLTSSNTLMPQRYTFDLSLFPILMNPLMHACSSICVLFSSPLLYGTSHYTQLLAMVTIIFPMPHPTVVDAFILLF